MLYLEHATLLTTETRLDDAALVLNDGIIQHLGTAATLPCPSGAERIDLRGGILAPGYLDLQLNGAFGHDFTANPETIWQVAEQLPRYGVTGFLPTIITSPASRTDLAIQVLRERPANFRGAEPLGLHFEGPFLNPQKKGAHNPAYLCAPDLHWIENWSRANGVWLVTLAPELPNALELVKTLESRGVVVSIGHTMSTVAEANAGRAAGIRYATHLFNAMPALEHRAPGAAGAILADSAWISGVIPDGIHLHPALVSLIWNAKGKAAVNIVSDAMAALGMPPGTYRLNDYDVIVSEQDARLPNGTLAGSILPMDQAVRNLIAFTGCALADALATVTITPARLLNIENTRGHIAKGMVADLIVLDDTLNVTMTIARGQIAYSI